MLQLKFNRRVQISIVLYGTLGSEDSLCLSRALLRLQKPIGAAIEEVSIVLYGTLGSEDTLCLSRALLHLQKHIGAVIEEVSRWSPPQLAAAALDSKCSRVLDFALSAPSIPESCKRNILGG